MEIIRDFHNIRPRHRGCVLTMGNFDGVHLGHQALLAHLAEKSKECGVPSLLITLEPLPREFFKGQTMPARLTRFREKIYLLKKAKLDRILLIAFNENTAQRSAEWVIETLFIEALGVQHVVSGDDSRFGHEAKGDYEMLVAAGKKHGFGVSSMPTMRIQQERVSSSRIREFLGEGNLDAAASLLGHRYFIMGRVVYGRQLGRQLGAPTANIRLQRYQAALAGVFAVEIQGLDRLYQGVANIGVRPTVDGKEPLLEVHLFDFNDDIYGKALTVIFRHRIRLEQTFPGLEELRLQIEQDMRDAKEWFKNNDK